MSRDLNDLDSDFQDAARLLIAEMESRHQVTMRPFYTRRSVFVQAKLWRQSRSGAQVRAAVSKFKDSGAPFLASVLHDVGAQYGRWATNALPGLSWHNWGRAMDCFPQIEGRAVWDADHVAYRLFAETAKDLGLVSGYYWRSKDAVHVQPIKARVIESKTWREINDEMRARY